MFIFITSPQLSVTWRKSIQTISHSLSDTNVRLSDIDAARPPVGKMLHLRLAVDDSPEHRQDVYDSSLANDQN